MAIIEQITAYLQPRHPAKVDESWEYHPAIEMRVSPIEQTVELMTTRDMGYSRFDGKTAFYPPYNPVGDWSFRISIPATIEGMEQSQPFRIRVNQVYLQQIVEVTRTTGVPALRVRFIEPHAAMIFLPADREACLILQMPLRMASETP
jgi:hypothetical protein